MTQSYVAALVKGITINRELRLVLSHLWVSDMHILPVTPHHEFHIPPAKLSTAENP